MNTALSALFQGLGNLVKWWVSIMPWEAGLRIKFGKHVTLLGPGIHLRIPLVHTVYRQGTRMRRIDMAVQTITTRDRVAITLGATLGYRIGNIQTLYETLHDAEGTLSNLVQSAIAEYINTHDATECSPHTLEEAVNATLNFQKYGLEDATISLTDFAAVRTYRLIQDTRWGGVTDRLDTNFALKGPNL